MIASMLLLAQSDEVSVEETFRNVDYRSLVLWGVLVVVTLAAFIWATFFRRRRRHRHHFHRAGAAPPPVEKHRSWSWRRLLGRKRRHRRRRERRVNPTRAETGGLPPVRADESPHTID